MNPREGLITDHADSAPLVLPTQAVFVQREGHGLNASVAELVGDLRRVHEQLGGAFAAGTAPKQPKGCVARLAKVLVAAQLRPNLYASELGPQMRVILVGDLLLKAVAQHTSWGTLVAFVDAGATRRRSVPMVRMLGASCRHTAAA